MTPEEQAADLLKRGYREVTEYSNLVIGQRVRHVGQRYSQALDHGTATIERIFHHPDSQWSRSHDADDVEVIVQKDDGSYGFWANYHTVTVRAGL